jgi:hypothetical protein
LIISCFFYRKSDRLADGRIVVSYDSLPIDQNLKLYPVDKKKHMMIFGGILLKQETLEVLGDEPSRYIAKSTPRAEDLLLRSTGRTVDGKVTNKLDMSDIYGTVIRGMVILYGNNFVSLGQSTKVSSLQMDNPMKLAQSTNTPPRTPIVHVKSKTGATPFTTKAIHVKSIFKANLMMEFMPDWM